MYFRFRSFSGRAPATSIGETDVGNSSIDENGDPSK